MATKAKRDKEIKIMITQLGWEDVEVKTAEGHWELNGKKSKYALTYIKDGKSKARLVHNGSDYLYWLLKAELRSEDCSCGDGLETVSNYGSSITQTCSKCMGYSKGKNK